MTDSDAARRARKGCYVVIGYDQYDYRDYEVGQYISLSRAKKAARNKARMANADPTSLSDVYFVYDDAGECRYQVTFDDLPAHLQQPAARLDMPETHPLRSTPAPLGWRDWPTGLALPLLLGLHAFDAWYELHTHNGYGYWGNVILHHGLGIPFFAGLSLISLVLFYFLPLYLWLVHARRGLSWRHIRENPWLLRWVLGGLVLGNGFGLILAVAVAYLLGMYKAAYSWPLIVLSVVVVQIPYYLWLRRQPDDALR